MSKTAKEMERDAININNPDNPEDTVVITFEFTGDQFQAYKDQLCREQAEQCAKRYSQLKPTMSINERIEAIRNAPKPNEEG